MMLGRFRPLITQHHRHLWQSYCRPANTLGVSSAQNISSPNAVVFRLFSSRRRRTPGRGGESEEHFIANTIRTIKEMNPRLVVEVMNACNVSVTPRLFPASSIPGNATVLLRILTRADLLSKEALRYQIQQAQHEGRSNNKYTSTAVIAMDLSNADDIKLKSLRPLMNALAGAAKLAGTEKAVVCGTPNAGKSSFILPLTKHRTLKVRKKRDHHLPKISSTAGWTLSTKKHVLETGGNTNCTLVDTPGLRPRVGGLDDETKALLIACGAMEHTKGLVTENVGTMIVELTLKALNRHGMVSNVIPPYVQALGRKEPTSDPVEFLETYQAANSDVSGTGVILRLIRQSQTGELGGLLFETSDPLTSAERRTSDDKELPVNRNSPIVCMNDEAMRLVNIGNGTVEARPLSSEIRTSQPAPKRPAETRSEGAQSLRPDGRNQASSFPKDEVVTLPEYQQDYQCMKCASFIKEASIEGTGFCGVRHNRCIGWNDHDIRSYFSRMMEAFGGIRNRNRRYLMRDSLACTLAAKYKLRSRRKVYKKYGSRSLGGYPVPNSERPLRFRSDQPVPLKFECTSRAKTSCRARAKAEKANQTGLSS